MSPAHAPRAACVSRLSLRAALLLLAARGACAAWGKAAAAPPSAEEALLPWLAAQGASLGGAEIRAATATQPRGVFATRDFEGAACCQPGCPHAARMRTQRRCSCSRTERAGVLAAHAHTHRAGRAPRAGA